jgi:hypothetical protein
VHIQQARRWYLVAAVVTTIIGIVLFIFGYRRLEQVATIIGLVSSVLGILAVILTIQSDDSNGRVKVKAAQQALLQKVRNQWKAEISARGLDDKASLVVRWGLTDKLNLMDHPENIAPQLEFYGTTDKVPDLAEQFKEKLQFRRLVIISEPGMGKTTLAVLLLNALADFLEDNPESKEPVPVFFSLSDWRVETETLAQWLIRRLREAYPQLEASGRAAPEKLVNTQRLILPILDGLDELPEEVLPQALDRLNDRAGEPLILTCRTEEFKNAVHSGHPITQAAVIDARPLTPQDKAEYLRRSIDPGFSEKWREVIEDLSGGQSNSAIEEALATPLRLWLLRRVCDGGRLDPEKVIDSGNPEKTHEYLLDKLIPQVIAKSNKRAEERRNASRNSEEKELRQYEGRHTWKPSDAEYWLGYLAHYFAQQREPTRNFKWWQLRASISLPGIRVVAGVVAGAIFGLALRPLAVTVPICAVIGGLLFLLGEDAVPPPRYANLRLRHRGPELRKNLLSSFKYTATVGLVAMLAFSPFVGIKTAWTLGLTFVIAGGIAYTLSDSIATPTYSDNRPSTPQSTLRSDRIMTGVHILAVGISVTLALWVAFPFRSAVAIGAAFALVGGLGSVLKIPLPRRKPFPIPFGFTEMGTAWANFIPTRIIFAARRKFPWRLMSFLDDCYRLQLLKQEGARYQFRHYELQKRLAETYRSLEH